MRNVAINVADRFSCCFVLMIYGVSLLMLR